MTKTALENAVRAWLVAAGATGGIPNADRTVIFADQNGTRPSAPYLVVKAVTPSISIGQDEEMVNDASPPVHRVRGQRWASFSVNAFGETAYDWLERAVLNLRAPSVKALNQAAGIAVQPLGGLNNLSGLRDTHTEARWQQDFRVDFERVAETEEVVPLEVVVHEDTWESDQSADLVETVTINL